MAAEILLWIIQVNKTQAPDDIDISELFSALWSAKWLIILVTAISALVSAAWLSILQLQRGETTYVQNYVDITGIIDRQYPNGTSFSPTDLISPDVLSKLVEAYPTLNQENILKGIRIDYGHPDSKALRIEWDEALKQAKDGDLSIEQLRVLNQNYGTELKRLNSGSISISVRHDVLNVSASTAISITENIPSIWQSVFVEKHKMTLPPPIANMSALNVPQTLTSSADILLAQLYVDRLQAALNVAARNPRLAKLQSASGYDAQQLSFDAEQFVTFQLFPMIASQLEKGDPLVQSRLRMLELRKKRIENIKNNVTQTIAELTQIQNSSVGRVNAQEGSEPTLSAQIALSEDALSSVINLAQEAELNDYLIELFKKSNNLATQLASLEKEVGKLTLSQSKVFAPDASVALAELRKLVSEFKLLVEVWENESSRASMGMFSVSVPAQLVGNDMGFNERSQLILALGAALGLFLGLTIVIMRVRNHNLATGDIK